MKFFFKNDGFTFIEQVIVLAIISFLTVTAIFTFTNVTIKQKHFAARDEMVFNLQKIQNYSMTGRKVESLDLNEGGNKIEIVPKYFGVFIKDEQNYLVFADLNGDGIYSKEDKILDKVEIDSELRLSPNLGTFLSVVPGGSFCYHTSVMLPVTLDCVNSRTQQIMIDSTAVSHTISIDPILGDISFIE